MHWTFESRAGVFAIRMVEGRFRVYCGDENLGSYANPQAALEDLVRGHTWSPSSGVDPSKLGIPDDLSEWESHG